MLTIFNRTFVTENHDINFNPIFTDIYLKSSLQALIHKLTKCKLHKRISISIKLHFIKHIIKSRLQVENFLL